MKQPNLASWLVNFLLPEPKVLEKPFGKMLPWLCILLLITIVIGAVPPIRDTALIHWISPAQRHEYHIDKSEIVGWINWIQLTLQLIIGIAIGGQVFSAALKNKFETMIGNYQSERMRVISQRCDAAKDDVKEQEKAIIEIMSREVSLRTIICNLYHLWIALRQLKKTLLNDAPRLSRALIFVQFYSSFPGGLYGLVAYVSFVVIMILSVATNCMDSSVMH